MVYVALIHSYIGLKSPFTLLIQVNCIIYIY